MSKIGNFIVTAAAYESGGLKSVTITLQSTGEIDVRKLYDLAGVKMELRRTPQGFSAYGRSARRAEAES